MISRRVLALSVAALVCVPGRRADRLFAERKRN
jgi:hypothetical protein